MEVISIICDTCGGNLQHISDNLYQCSACRGQKFVRNYSDEEMFMLQGADVARIRSKSFPPAIMLYENLLKINAENVNALWGLFMAEYGVEYVRDDVTNEYHPIFHPHGSLSPAPMLRNRYYKKVIKLTAAEEQERYSNEAARLAAIWDKITEKLDEKPQYEVFIRYPKNDKQQTDWAYNMAETLERQGVNVFISNPSVSDGDDEPNIYAALLSARAAIILCPDDEYFERNEHAWWRFYEYGQGGFEIQCIVHGDDVDPYCFPRELQPKKDNALNAVNAHYFDVTDGDCPMKVLDAVSGKIGSIARKLKTYIDGTKASKDLQDVSSGGKGIAVGSEVYFGRYQTQYGVETEVRIKPTGEYEMICGGDRLDVETPIIWVVLANDGNEMLLVSKYFLMEAPYCESGKVLASKRWEQSDIRKMLNGKFFESWFTDYEKQFVLPSKLRDNVRYVLNGEERAEAAEDGAKDVVTCDNVFLLSVGEAEKALTMVELPTSMEYDSYTYHWWLRTSMPNFRGDDGEIAYVDYADGKIDTTRAGYRNGIRPAIRLQLGDDFNEYVTFGMPMGTIP